MTTTFICMSRPYDRSEPETWIADLGDPTQIGDYRSGWTTNGAGEPVALPFDAWEVPEERARDAWVWWECPDA